MSLRYQINLRIFLSALCILILGGSIAIWQARHAVSDEVDSSIKLAQQLIKIGFVENNKSSQESLQWLSRLNGLQETRHLNIQLKAVTGKILSSVQKRRVTAPEDRPPVWFIKLVNDSPIEIEFPLSTVDGKQLSIVIQANPIDEITEVWGESLVFFISLSLLTFLTFIMVNLVFRQTLQPIEQIVAGLRRIEIENYEQKLPDFAVQEFDEIGCAINQMASNLKCSQYDNRALTKHTLEIQEEERQRLAQELHDELGQSLTAIKVMAVTAAHPKSDINFISESITEICDHLIGVVRTMMHHLHPLVLVELGLTAALEEQVQLWQKRSPELQIVMQCEKEIDKLDKKITIQVFRVIQECLTNIVRHAQAQNVTIKLLLNHQEEQKQLHLFVSDNGRGCDMNQLKTGFGLRSIQERIKSLEGVVEIKSTSGEGMHLTANIPLK